MDSDDKKSAKVDILNQLWSGPRELTGDVDFISLFGLLPHYDFFCKRSLPESISDTHYLCNVLGDTEIRKGEGMELGQLIQSTHLPRDTNTHIQPFELDILKEAFHLMESDPIDLPSSEKGTPTIAGKFISESEDKEKTHEKHMDSDKDKSKEHKHWHKHRSYKEKNKEKSGHSYTGNDRSRRHHEKKRKHDGDDDSCGHSET